jgi:hypothetical protein
MPDEAFGPRHFIDEMSVPEAAQLTDREAKSQ